MALERVEPISDRIEIHPLRLYREDLLRIWEILSQLGQVEATVNDKFKITDPSGWEELARSTREPVTSVEFSAKGAELSDPRISVTLRKHLSNYIHVYQVNNEARGLMSLIKDELREHRKFNPPLWVRALITFGLAVPIAVLMGIWIHSMGADAWVSVGIYATVGFFAGAGSLMSTTKSKFLNATYAEAPKFRERLLEDGGVNLFWTLVGIGFGGVMGYLVNQIPPLSG
ncbi:hypothetical protein KGD82_16390 [Nocardiopsis eucommiae]|uniref:Uncharacterized protein n=1 Tax=Nocardiopsis eucommiae TaxID=2831970 RepID=A0A975L711_9ACTN|nr:hypothetical protein KGD82_16390 [Nocardiopsis eucommiae]